MKFFTNILCKVAPVLSLAIASVSCVPSSANTPEIVVWPHQASDQLHVVRDTAQPFYIMAYNRGVKASTASEVEITVPQNWHVWRGSEAPPASDEITGKERVIKFALPLRRTKDTADSKDYSSGNSAGNLLLVARPLVQANESILKLRWLQGEGILAESQAALKPVDLPKPALQSNPNKLTAGMWLNDPKFNTQTMAQVYQGLRRCGIDYVIITKEMYEQSKEALSALGIKVIVNQWWGFHDYLPNAPPEAAYSTLKDSSIDKKRWSPTYMAENGSEFLKAVDAIADELKGMKGIYGFMIDFEPGVDGIEADYGAQSKVAFEKYLGQKDLAWPADVLPNGKYEEKWIDFRNDQSEAYVGAFQKAIKQRAPGVFFSVSTSGATGKADDPNRRLAATDITQFSRVTDSIHPQLYSWPSNLPAQLERFNDKLNLGHTTIAGSKAKVYPAVGTMVGKAALSNPAYLRTQVLNWWFRGASGFEVWQYFYGVDGRYMAMVSELAHLFGEAGEKPDGSSAENTILTAAATDTLEILNRKSADGKAAWVGLFNFSSKPIKVPLQVKNGWRLSEATSNSITIAPWTAQVVKCVPEAPRN